MMIDPTLTISSIGLHLRKLVYFIRIYGIRRTFAKVVGRLRLSLHLPMKRSRQPDIAMIGCGQFGFATIGHFLVRRFGTRFLWCYDPDRGNRISFARHYRVRNVAEQPSGWLQDPAVQTVYIASNHASHSDYAVEALRAGKTVYVEKPLACSLPQLRHLEATRVATGGRIYCGYNRPFSPAVREIRRALGEIPEGGISLSCFVAGHVLSPNHWYRKPDEGTRICGNAGHWIDLFVHMLSWRKSLPEHLRLSLVPASLSNPDDNFSLTIATDMDDVFSLVLSSRYEPFCGIRETINFQQGDTSATIDDFRRLTLWTGSRCLNKRYRFKDVGHHDAVLQPYSEAYSRDWDEVVRSTALTLTFAELVRQREVRRDVVLTDLLEAVRK